MHRENLQINIQKTWVVFSGHTDLPWLRILKPGFRHCSVLINDGTHWITFDPLSNYTDIMVHNMPVAFDLPLWLKERGHKVIAANIDRHKTPAPWMLFTCVEAVKRVLGIHKLMIFMPWQLYQYLTNPYRNQSHIYKGELAWEV